MQTRRAILGSPLLILVCHCLADALALTQCIDAKASCGATGDGSGDDTGALQKCITLAAASNDGCVTVPAGTYPVTHININVSNVQLLVDAGATLLPPRGSHSGQLGSGIIGIGSSVDSTPAHNVSVLGVGGQFVIDCTLQGVGPDYTRVSALRVLGNTRDFVIGNIRTKMAYGKVGPNGKGKDLNTNAIAMGNVLVDGVSYHPIDGHVFNITNSGSWGGYGLVQVQSAENILFEYLDSTGGSTLRMETGVQRPGSYVGNITGHHIICRSGANAFEASPHSQQNGDFYITDVKSFSCFLTVDLANGYVDHSRNPSATIPGFFGNGSYIHGVTAYFGRDSQCDTRCRQNVLNGSSCAPCGMGLNAQHPAPGINWQTDIQNVSAVGFPWDHDYSRCTSFNRHETDCGYWPQATSIGR